MSIISGCLPVSQYLFVCLLFFSLLLSCLHRGHIARRTRTMDKQTCICNIYMFNTFFFCLTAAAAAVRSFVSRYLLAAAICEAAINGRFAIPSCCVAVALKTALLKHTHNICFIVSVKFISVLTRLHCITVPRAFANKWIVTTSESGRVAFGWFYSIWNIPHTFAPARPKLKWPQCTYKITPVISGPYIYITLYYCV